MAYTAVYREEKIQSSERGEYNHVTLDAKFRFREEVAPNNRKTISERIDSLMLFSEIPVRFFYGVLDHKHSRHYLKRWFALGFDIHLKSRLKTNNPVVNLDAIDKYILTGQ